MVVTVVFGDAGPTAVKVRLAIILPQRDAHPARTAAPLLAPLVVVVIESSRQWRPRSRSSRIASPVLATRSNSQGIVGVADPSFSACWSACCGSSCGWSGSRRRRLG
jgi:hypothetical protein